MKTIFDYIMEARLFFAYGLASWGKAIAKTSHPNKAIAQRFHDWMMAQLGDVTPLSKAKTEKMALDSYDVFADWTDEQLNEMFSILDAQMAQLKVLLPQILSSVGLSNFADPSAYLAGLRAKQTELDKALAMSEAIQRDRESQEEANALVEDRLAKYEEELQESMAKVDRAKALTRDLIQRAKAKAPKPRPASKVANRCVGFISKQDINELS